MAISIPAGAHTNLTASGTSAAINLPAGIQAGDLLVMHIYSGYSDIIASGWTADNLGYHSDSGNYHYRFWKIAGESEGSTATISRESTNAFTASATSYRATGVDTTTPFTANNTLGQEVSEDPFTLAANSLTGMTAGNACVVSWGYYGGARSVTTVSAPLTGVSTGGENLFCAYETLSGTGNSSYSVDMSDVRPWEWVLYELAAAAASAPTITDAGDEVYYTGETGIVITGTNFGASQGAGTVKISPTDNVADAGAITQTVTSWADTSITFTAVKNSGANTLPSNTNCYLFVTNNSAASNETGHVVQINLAPIVMKSRA